MAITSGKMKIASLVILALAYQFYQGFWLQGAFSANGVQFNDKPSTLTSLAMNQGPKLERTNLFGVYEKSDSDEGESIVEIFDSASQEFIGQVGNTQYLLYATAKFGGAFSAKLLIKDLETDEVYLATVNKNDSIENVIVADIELSEVILALDKSKQTPASADAETDIKLLLFTKITPPSIDVEATTEAN